MEEICANCGKVRDEHIPLANGVTGLWCDPAHRSLRMWTPPEPQAALFETEKITTGYEK